MSSFAATGDATAQVPPVATVLGPFETEHQGVPLCWVEAPGTVVGGLTFGVGAADEPAHLVGITHLVEHLLFRSMGTTNLRANAVTGVDTVTFFTVGTVDEVVDFLHDVARAVREPRFTEADLERELHVVRAERPNGVDAVPGLLTHRFGLGGPGNAAAGWPALPAVTLDEARGWVARWFVAQNAALTLSTAPPADLDVRLPAGRRPSRTEPVERVRVPTLVATPKAGVGISLLVPAEHADLLADCLLQEVTTELRTRRALVYCVDTETVPVGADRCQVELLLDPLTADVPAVAEGAVLLLRRLAHDGFAAEVLAEAVDALAAGRGLLDEPLQRLGRWADAAVIGRRPPPDPADEVARARAVTSADLAAVLAGALPTLVVAHEEDAPVEERASALGLEVDDGLPFEETRDRVPRGVRMRRPRGGGPRLGVDAHHVWGRVGGTARRIPLADVVLVVVDEDAAVLVVDRMGRALALRPEQWPRAEAMAEQIAAGAPDAVVRRAVWPDRGRSRFRRSGL
ncbi:insulinase family protein [Nocardioides zeae]|uniref:Insulinase family protein n=1 Tax=Nocardioides imazamoxiresistens TaxID=3231893 RepID=A0ABU3PRD1_9ACTN|nr:insulinase family protein [Nocardioides zeae]MDT9591772.1 insulinase family protein [Nocardioides zeae]